jgi:biotin carboxyl carrier protein
MLASSIQHSHRSFAACLAICIALILTAPAAGQGNGFSPNPKSVNGLPIPKYSNAAQTPPSLNLDTAVKNSSQPPKGSSKKRSLARPKLPATNKTASSSNTLGQPASYQQRSGGKDISVNYCSIEFVDDIKLPALEAGAIRSVTVEEGQFITAGTIVGQIDDALPQLELKRAKMRYSIAYDAATDSTSITAAQKEYELAKTVYEKNRRLARNGSRSESEVKESQFRAEIAQLKRSKASNDQQAAFGEAKVELAAMDAVKQHIARHTLRSDYNAYVVEIFKKPQEFVNVGDDVMRLARMDRMWVQANIENTKLSAADAENRPVTVSLKTSKGVEEFEGKIDQVSLEFVSGDEYQVKVKIENRRDGNSWLLRPFSQVSMVIHLD